MCQGDDLVTIGTLDRDCLADRLMAHEREMDQEALCFIVPPDQYC